MDFESFRTLSRKKLMKKAASIIFLLSALLIGFLSFSTRDISPDSFSSPNILSHTIDPQNQSIAFFWKDTSGQNLRNFQQLKSMLNDQGKELAFAMNGGMYNKDFSPQGLYIENGEILADIDTVTEGYGNFYLQPNGIFYLTNDYQAVVTTTDEFENIGQIKYATQSGPMLVIDGKLHPKFNEGSSNVHIRNGVGILPNGHLLFVMSKEKINFFDFATYFKENGCKHALYLDGFVSKAFLPAKNWEQMEGSFGVMIGEFKDIN